MTRTSYFTLLFCFFVFLSCSQPQKVEANRVGMQEVITKQEFLSSDTIKTKIPSHIIVDGCDDIDKQWLLDNVFIHSYIDKADMPKGNIDLSKLINEDGSLAKIGEHRIELACQDTVVIFEDLIEDEYGYYSNHYYIGKIDVLNSYLIFVEYLEVSNYLLVDIKTGAVENLDPYLIFSPDGKSFVSAGHGAPDVSEGYITIYTKDNGAVKQLASLHYDSWGTKEYASHTDGIWTADGSVYFAMQKDRYSDEIRYFKLHINFDKLKKLSQK